MMRMNNIVMSSVVPKMELLEKLRSNLSQHSIIVKEAIEGYIKKAKEALGAKLDQISSGKVVTLQFYLKPPTDHSEVYRTVISMLEWTTEDKITLRADEFRQLVLDEWDWTDEFYATNQLYSGTATRIAREKGL